MATNSEPKTVVFSWDFAQFDTMVAVCDWNDEIQIGLPYLPKDGLILEAGAGSGRIVKYLHDRGYNIEGIELSREAVAEINRRHPELRIRVGDVAQVPVPDNHYAGLLSFGVVEHFVEDMRPPLREHFRVLKPGGIAVITVPSFNVLRRIKYAFDLCFRRLNPRMNNTLRRVLGKRPVQRNRRGANFQYHVYPQFHSFFEYRLRPAEFEQLCRECGFRILASEPIGHMDGLYHEIGEPLVRYRDFRFEPSGVGRWLNAAFSRVRFFHNHMHAIIATKP